MGYVKPKGEPEKLSLAQSLERELWRVAVEDAEMLLQDFCQWPIGDPFSV